MTVVGFDHVQLAVPARFEEELREFYGGVLGMTELPKPPALAARGGCWFAAGTAVLHLGVQEPFLPARKAHPALLVDDLDALQARLEAAGYACVRSDGEVPGVLRFHTHDVVGNRVEFQQGRPFRAAEDLEGTAGGRMGSFPDNHGPIRTPGAR